MEVLDTTNIEIQIPDLGLDDGVAGRRDYRVDTSGRDDFFLRLRGTAYPVLDAGASGVRISIEEQTVLAEDEVVHDCELRLGQDIFAGLRGRIVHCSVLEESGWVAGIEWVDMDRRVVRAMLELMKQLRSELFGNE